MPVALSAWNSLLLLAALVHATEDGSVRHGVDTPVEPQSRGELPSRSPAPTVDSEQAHGISPDAQPAAVAPETPAQGRAPTQPELRGVGQRPELGLAPVARERELQGQSADGAETGGVSSSAVPPRPVESPLRRYLARPRFASARHLDHGAFEFGLSGGLPEVYRLSVGVGLLDHVTIGVATHWLPDQPWPQLAPWASLALLRSLRFELGFHYRSVLYPPPPDDESRALHRRKRDLPVFQRRAHYILGSATFSSNLISVGFDAGWVHRRVVVDTEFEASPYEYVRRNRIAGALHVRVGTRRWGIRAMAAFPEALIELGVDLRIKGFGLREAGNWRPVR